MGIPLVKHVAGYANAAHNRYLSGMTGAGNQRGLATARHSNKLHQHHQVCLLLTCPGAFGCILHVAELPQIILDYSKILCYIFLKPWKITCIVTSAYIGK